MKTVTFTVTIDDANLLFKGLGKLPFEQVYTLIGKLNEQANQQLSGNAASFISTGNSSQNGDGH